MRGLTFFGICAFIFVFAASQAYAAISSSQMQCTSVRIPDMMDIKECINEPLQLCGEGKEDARTTSRRLALCLVKSMATRNFLEIVIKGLAQAGVYAMRASLPGSSLVAFPLLNRFRSFFRSTRGQNRIILTSRPCNQTVEVIFPDFLKVGNCVRPEHFMCTRNGWMNLRTQLVTSLLSMIVCIMRKLPFFNVLFLLKDLMCAGLQLLRQWLTRIEMFPIAVPVVEFFEVLSRCDAQNAMPSMPQKTFPGSFDFRGE